jgi:hypothetical protein
MHGDESTATAALLDLTKLLTSPLLSKSCDIPLNLDYQSKVTLYILPMLNPDGAQDCSRENAQGIDINRDALALQTPEGKILNTLVEEIKPHYAFNLHDQHDYYRCGKNGKSVTLALLAPAFNDSKSIDSSRYLAMGIIAKIYETCSPLLPHGIARYDDAFSPTSFGDKIAAKGVSTILIESGHYPNDENRQVARTINVYALLHALANITDNDLYANQRTLNDVFNVSPTDLLETLESKYLQIPENNENKLCDLLIKNLNFSNSTYKIDISLCRRSRFESDFYVSELGDLSQLLGHKTIEAEGYTFDPGRSFLINKKMILTNDSYINFLRQGFSHFVGNIKLINNQSDYKLVANPQFWHDEHRMIKGMIPAGFLCLNGERSLALLVNKIIQL